MRPEPQHAPSPSPCASPRHLPKGPLTSPGQRRGWEWPLGPWVPSPGPGALTAPKPPHPQPGTTGQGLATPQASPAAPELQLHLLLPRALSSSGPSIAIAPHWFGLTLGPRPFSHTLGLYVSTGLTTAGSAPPHNLARINTTYLLKKTN